MPALEMAWTVIRPGNWFDAQGGPPRRASGGDTSDHHPTGGSRRSAQCPLAAITAGTKDSAAAMGVSKRIGTIETGKKAGLLLVEGDPSRNLEDLHKVKAVFRGGVKVPCPSPGFYPSPSGGHT